jgi:hypothetical protein
VEIFEAAGVALYDQRTGRIVRSGPVPGNRHPYRDPTDFVPYCACVRCARRFFCQHSSS